MRSVPDAASVLIALESYSSLEATAQVQRCLDLILGSQASDGGWGPYMNSPSEAFDTALVLLALFPLADEPRIQELIEQAWAYLIGIQFATGGWPATTRPPGAPSYAHYGLAQDPLARVSPQRHRELFFLLHHKDTKKTGPGKFGMWEATQGTKSSQHYSTTDHTTTALLHH